MRVGTWPDKPHEGDSNDDSTNVKNETSLDPNNTFFTTIQNNLVSTLGSNVDVTSADVVGVLVDEIQGCPEICNKLTIGMDTENDNNANNETGWHGTSGSGFILTPSVIPSVVDWGLQFCIVPTQYFERIKNVNYAVLKLTYNQPAGTSCIVLYEDLQDRPHRGGVYSGPQYNYDFDNNYLIYDGGFSYPDAEYPFTSTTYVTAPLHFAANNNLSFIYYPSSTNGSSSFQNIPGLGKEYGIFGEFGSNYGNIYFDDDDSNVNTIGVNL